MVIWYICEPECLQRHYIYGGLLTTIRSPFIIIIIIVGYISHFWVKRVESKSINLSFGLYESTGIDTKLNGSSKSIYFVGVCVCFFFQVVSWISTSTKCTFIQLYISLFNQYSFQLFSFWWDYLIFNYIYVYIYIYIYTFN